MCFLKLPADKLLVFQLMADSLSMVTSLLFEVNYTFINRSFAFSLCSIYIKLLYF